MRLKAFMKYGETRAQQLPRWATVPKQSGPKSGGAAVLLSVWELGPYLTQCRLSRGLPPYQVAFGCIQPCGYNSHGRNIAVLCPSLGVIWVPI